MVRRLLLALVLLLPSPAAAETLAGSWALRLDGAIIFRFDLEPDGQGWTGGWVRPGSFASDGNRFGSLSGSERLEAEEGRAIGEWAELTFADPRPGAEPDVFRFHLIGPDRAEMIYAGTGLAPYILERVAAGALLGPWEEGRVYGRGGANGGQARRQPPPAEGAERQPARERPRQDDSEEVQGPPAMIGR